jgi:hypothetical protein
MTHCSPTRLFRFAACILLILGLVGVNGCSKDPAIVGRSTAWFRTIDPNVFFRSERNRGLIYFIGIYDPSAGANSPVPGVSRQDPYFLPYNTWFVPANSIADPKLNQEFLEAAKEFAERYNPLVLRYLKENGAKPKSSYFES